MIITFKPIIRKNLFFLLLLVHFSKSESQSLSTYFLDSLKVIINKDTLAYTGQTKIFFFKNTRDTQLVVFQTRSYKLALDFKFYEQSTYTVQEAWPVLYKNNSRVNLGMVFDTAAIKICDIMTGKTTLISFTQTPANPDQIFVKINYRTTFLAPVDTSHYSYPYRQGPWIGRYKIGKKDLNATLYVNYTKDLKDGSAKIVWEDDGEFETPFKDGIRLSEGHFNLEKAKRAKFRKRPIPNIIFDECSTF